MGFPLGLSFTTSSLPGCIIDKWPETLQDHLFMGERITIYFTGVGVHAILGLLLSFTVLRWERENVGLPLPHLGANCNELSWPEWPVCLRCNNTFSWCPHRGEFCRIFHPHSHISTTLDSCLIPFGLQETKTQLVSPTPRPSDTFFKDRVLSSQWAKDILKNHVPSLHAA